MKLTTLRKDFDENCTIGELYVNGKLECYTLEPVVRDQKIFGKTAIPYGEYEVTITYSPKFGRQMPLINSVPGFDGVRIHPGNLPSDTEGCLLVGDTKGKDQILQSRAAFDPLFAKIKAAIDNNEKVTIEYTCG